MNDQAPEPSSPAAIIGMGGMFAGAADVKSYWRVLLNGIDCITDPPASHDLLTACFDRDPKRPDHIYCNRGGFLPTMPFDPTEFGIPPAALEATDTSQLLGLVAAKMALSDAGYGDDRDFDRERTSVILGVTGTQELVIALGSRLGHPFWRRALEGKGLSEDQQASIMAEIADCYVPWQENSFPGLLGNVVAGRICNRLNLGGTNCVVDAACASSLGALHLALMELNAGKTDLVVTGGVDTINDIFMHMCFSKTGVLSRSGDARPFSAQADGTVLGEGIGILVLKRLVDAERDGDRIYAVIRGMGSSSDGKSQSIYAPRAEGQARALREAYHNAGIHPASVELVEAHGTGTRVGDEVEFAALKAVFGDTPPNGRRCALGSVKSMIGHTKAAAGAAGLIKSALALHHKVIPPTLKADPPDPKLSIDSSSFYLNRQARPWFPTSGHPRRSGVSSFGFGGANFHVVLEEYRPVKTEAAWDGSVVLLPVSGDAAPSIRDALHGIVRQLAATNDPPSTIRRAANSLKSTFSADHPHRLVAVVDASASPDQLTTQLQSAIQTVTRGQSAASASQGIYYGTTAREYGQIAFIFPGQGSQYPNMGRALTCVFPEAMDAVEAANRHFAQSTPLWDYLYPLPHRGDEQPRPAETLRSTDVAQPAIGAVSLAMLAVLARFKLRPDAVCGHSYGELPALHAAGRIDRDTLLALSAVRGRLMADAGRGDDAGAMLAAKGPIEVLQRLADRRPDIVLANINSPDQGVFSGPRRAIDAIQAACDQKGLRTVVLPVAAAFHSPLVAAAAEPFARAVNDAGIVGGSIPVYANVTAAPYPADNRECAGLLGRQMTSPVRFQETIERLYADGIRTFLEVGPKSVLSGLVRSILGGRAKAVIPMDRSGTEGEEGIADLAHAIAHLSALGVPTDLSAWESDPAPVRAPKMNVPLCGTNYRTHRPARATAAPACAGPDEHPRRTSGITTPTLQPPTLRSTAMKDPATPPSSTAPAGHRDDPLADPAPSNATDLDATLRVVQQGLDAIQAIQQQTASAHQLFLETQAQASRTLQAIMRRAGMLVQPESPSQPNPPLVQPAAPMQPNDQPRPAPSPAAVGYAPPPVAESSAPSPRQASAPSLNPPPPTDGGAADTAVQATLLDVVAELTGYPQAMLGLEMDIEADLGIDSIKRVEILSAMEGRMPDLPQVTPDMVGTLKTLGQIVAFLSAGAVPTASVDARTRCASPTDGGAVDTAVQRLVVDVRERPESPTRPLRIAPHRWIGVLGDAAGLAGALVAKLRHARLDARPMDADRIDREGALAGIAGLIVCADAGPETAFRAARSASPELLAASTGDHDALFACITRMDGAFGFSGQPFDDPEQGALAGLVKTAALEWPSVTCRAIDLAPTVGDIENAAARAVAALTSLGADDPVEIGLARDQRVELQPVPAESVPGSAVLDPTDVVVVTGGGRGVTAACAIELARATGCAVALIGRSAPPVEVPAGLRGIEDEAGMKKAILANGFGGSPPTPAALEKEYRRQSANREIAATMEALARAGVRSAYFSADVTDLAAVRTALSAIREQLGPITGIIHGAGVLQDRLIADKTTEQFRRVYATKVTGWKHLLAATRSDVLRHLVVFSSVSARTGNTGQCDYAMANEALNKMARWEALARPDCRVTAINWGPWDGGMVTPSLKNAFAERRIALIPLEIGARMMVDELNNTDPSPVEMIIGSMLTESSREADGDPLALLERREVDLARYPVLASHVIGGKPVVPFALISEWIGHGALKENPGLALHGIDDFRLLSGIRIEAEKKLVRLMAGQARRTGDAWQVDIELRNGVTCGRDVIHSRAKALLVDRLPAAPVFPDHGTNGNRPYPKDLDAVYGDILFHGRQLRAIIAIDGYSDHGMTAKLASAPEPEAWMQDPIRKRWMADPMTLDGAFQMAIVWCFEQTGKVCLPSYARSYRQYRSAFPAPGVTAVMTVTTTTHRKLVADFTFLDDQRQVVATLQGYEATIDGSLKHAFQNNVLPPLPDAHRP